MTDLPTIYRAIAVAANADGVRVTTEDDYGGAALRRWLRANVKYRPETEFFIVLGVAGVLAELQPALAVQLELFAEGVAA